VSGYGFRLPMELIKCQDPCATICKSKQSLHFIDFVLSINRLQLLSILVSLIVELGTVCTCELGTVCTFECVVCNILWILDIFGHF
jgi:hypothetical protein